MTYTAALDAIGDVRSMELVVTPLLESSLPPRVSHGILRFRGHGGRPAHHGRQHLGAQSARAARLDAAGGLSHALVEQAILRASHLGLDSVPFDWAWARRWRTRPT